MSNHILHPYLRNTPIPSYKKCSSCRSKTQSTCVRCGYCYECHNASLAQSSPQQQQQRKVVDVYGKAIEPICSYRTCRHKFSLHNTHRCKCRNALNYAIGVSI
jgi:hypothetical protein